ncbi:hypothetical protein SNOG_11645 [Parastagonospora nodorum SN15]|uniref:Secreted protein n=1 Tax=Phaeosphaeria nodorum (strain SN15 / ATCC MYA-4574 / FGSC 10173) TaxID=321614 RepID=Q0U9B9_PHANO|nr:hypothetical protein SNOG_11645 [Parastagonospora nodorum SN15]EAT80689.1 hypothetical protein SNOG_11645 [Parastagonospora nodorum SN15]
MFLRLISLSSLQSAPCFLVPSVGTPQQGVPACSSTTTNGRIPTLSIHPPSGPISDSDAPLQ